MAIYRVDKSCALEDLVGRYVAKKCNTYVDGVADPRKVVGLLGRSLIVEKLPTWYSKEEREWVIGVAPEGIANRIVDLDLDRSTWQHRSVYLACDTLEEIAMLSRLRRAAEDRIQAAIKQSTIDLTALITPGPVPALNSNVPVTLPSPS